MATGASVLWQLEELDRATAMAENDYARFRWTRQSSRAGSGGPRRRTDGGGHARGRAGCWTRTARGGGYGGGLDGAIDAANDSFLDQQRDQQQLLVRKQDEDLDEISVSIQRIGQVGLTIGEELETQGKMLEELEEDVETNSRLAAAQRKMNAVLKKAGAGPDRPIAVLTVLLVILFVIAFG